MGDKTDIQFSLDDKCSTKNILFKNNIPLSFNNNIIYEKCQKKKII